MDKQIFKQTLQRFWKEGTGHAFVNIFADNLRASGLSEKRLDRAKYVLALIFLIPALLVTLARFFFCKSSCT
jgi:hypothetical protein